ncbi:hypothetical protein M408DRAFT_81089 [Serendipita vermifera MAFF 305830]|uniref:Ferric reductase NAD binding domain-containing protein n=1 Tax=Serendipita vermifera MAFF 305830 TaxID=933852 RepID=A0A0C3ALW4_SERVB|nr:hypothetical protein M408DRAFT_81089 [Serendipita vermifera MAFF 305830]
MQIERPYTPINGVGVDGKMTFWIKKYPGGEVSNWISKLQKNRNIEIRGPVQQWDWRSGSWDEIVMIGGGTGITAFTQLLHQALFSSQPVTSAIGSKTHFTLLHGHQSPSQMPPAIITEDFDLYRESSPGRFTERVFVDRLDGEADDIPRGVNVGRIDRKELESIFIERGIIDARSKRPNPGKSVMVLVCGPEG